VENKILIGTLTDRHSDHLVIDGVKIEVTEGVCPPTSSLSTRLWRWPTRSKTTRELPHGA